MIKVIKLKIIGSTGLGRIVTIVTYNGVVRWWGVRLVSPHHLEYHHLSDTDGDTQTKSPRGRVSVYSQTHWVLSTNSTDFSEFKRL